MKFGQRSAASSSFSSPQAQNEFSSSTQLMHVKRDNRLLPCLMLQICLSNMTPCLVCRDAIDQPVTGCVVVGAGFINRKVTGESMSVDHCPVMNRKALHPRCFTSVLLLAVASVLRYPKWQITRQQMRGILHLQTTGKTLNSPPSVPPTWHSPAEFKQFVPSSYSVHPWIHQRLTVGGLRVVWMHVLVSFPSSSYSLVRRSVRSLWFCQQLQHLILAPGCV